MGKGGRGCHLSAHSSFPFLPPSSDSCPFISLSHPLLYFPLSLSLPPSFLHTFSSPRTRSSLLSPPSSSSTLLSTREGEVEEEEEEEEEEEIEEAPTLDLHRGQVRCRSVSQGAMQLLVGFGWVGGWVVDRGECKCALHTSRLGGWVGGWVGGWTYKVW